MSKNSFFVPAMRIMAVLYFIYKLAFSDPNSNWAKLIEIDNSSAGRMTGDIVLKVVSGFIFIAFIIYQFRQAKLEFRQKASSKDRLRLFSIIWSLLFFTLAAISIFNVNLEVSNTSLSDYLTEFYTVSTIIGVIAGGIVIIRDIKIFRQLKNNKNFLQQQL